MPGVARISWARLSTSHRFKNTKTHSTQSPGHETKTEHVQQACTTRKLAPPPAAGRCQEIPHRGRDEPPLLHTNCRLVPTTFDNFSIPWDPIILVLYNHASSPGQSRSIRRFASGGRRGGGVGKISRCVVVETRAAPRDRNEILELVLDLCIAGRSELVSLGEIREAKNQMGRLRKRRSKEKNAAQGLFRMKTKRSPHHLQQESIESRGAVLNLSNDGGAEAEEQRKKRTKTRLFFRIGQ